ncbi:MAG: Cytochrome c oxidase polypeptide [Pedosphaera sp.]|nr:Cytochrome c oxidase polypeptide [Pedosphaera sp.]
MQIVGGRNRRAPGKLAILNTVRVLLALALAAGIVCGPGLHAAEAKKGQAEDLDQNFPFQTACIGTQFPAGNVAYKGIAIKLGNDAYMCFDTDLLRMAAGWTGDYLKFDGVAFSGAHGTHPSIAGDQKFGTKQLPGVADASGSFTDPRPEPFGPIPAATGRWDGLYPYGNKVVLAYTVGGTKVLEMPGSTVADGLTAFVRNFKTEKTKSAFALMICGVEGATGELNGNTAVLSGSGNNSVTLVGLAGAPRGVKLEIADGNQVVLKVPQDAAAATFKVVIWNGTPEEKSKFAGLLAGDAEVADVKHPGPNHWPETVVTQGVLDANSAPDGSYTVDQLPPPVDNPWHRRIRFSGFDFFADGKRAAVCTWDGDIWIVSGIDDTLQNLTWKRFASGQYETLGLKIVNDVIYTSGRDQITRYHDFNNDGEADYYENFNNQVTSSDGFHEFVFDLQTDPDGNFWFAKAGPVRPGGRGFAGPNAGTISADAGSMLKLSKDGSKLEVYATGFRAPNGIGVGPHGEITSGDNEGSWVVQCPINWVRKGGFYGVKDTAHLNPIPQRDPPLCWLDWTETDNSSGGQVWVTSDKWGPYKGEMLHLSYGKCALYLVLKEEVGGVMQGGVVRIPATFTSSAMRGRFNAKDGQLYIVGLQGWQTTAVKLAGFDRVRYTGKPVHSVKGLHITKESIQLTFTEPLDPSSANDVENYSSKRWNYVAKGDNYGANEISVVSPTKRGRDVVNITAASLSPDGRTVTLKIEDLKPVQQMSIKYTLKAKDGVEMSQDVQFTINKLP